VTWTLKLIEDLPSIPSQYFKKLVNTDDIWEVRIIYKNDIFRILGFFDGSKIIVLNHAFQKKTQKVPSQAIKLRRKEKETISKGGNKNENIKEIYLKS